MRSERPFYGTLGAFLFFFFLLVLPTPSLSATSDLSGSSDRSWTGLFLGGDVGVDVTSLGVTASGSLNTFPANPAFTTGFEYGFLYETPIKVVVGVDGYGNFNFASSTSRSVIRRGVPTTISQNFGTNAFGGDLRIGYDLGRFLPYAMIGAGTIAGTADAAGLGGVGVHAGLGVHYLVARYLSLFGEWSIQQATGNAAALDYPTGTANYLINNIVGGLSFYLWLPGVNGPY